MPQQQQRQTAEKKTGRTIQSHSITIDKDHRFMEIQESIKANAVKVCFVFAFNMMGFYQHLN